MADINNNEDEAVRSAPVDAPPPPAPISSPIVSSAADSSLSPATSSHLAELKKKLENMRKKEKLFRPRDPNSLPINGQSSLDDWLLKRDSKHEDRAKEMKALEKEVSFVSSLRSFGCL